ncbi:TetR/AcrR family transcriptional regulator [Amycolatopsis sp. H20-H5]|uniref:TetR/AcrR family transcriptional regulator n=1 Tax=Amycolatopsis sp. H20-H5 TaxID=3046309 RepID=UPI002DB6967E|nr:TetR/AcrR family transcriptional regulator [Amycolatopsis sp. H20-H5]MEC3977466.1 TetR/AcrR family transcriptional regulator [Amycolatopsis sp. H20-H5]
MSEAREKLLEAVIEHVAQYGTVDVSLRALAGAVGSSHRMLIYHFDSKEGLLSEVVREVEARQRAAFTGLGTGEDLSPLELARLFWRRLTDESLRNNEKLFFELYGQALLGRPGTTGLLDGIVESWLAPVGELLARFGIPEPERPAHARLALAVARGLLLDLLTTGDLEAVDSAMEQFLSGYAQRESRPV